MCQVSIWQVRKPNFFSPVQEWIQVWKDRLYNYRKLGASPVEYSVKSPSAALEFLMGTDSLISTHLASNELVKAQVITPRKTHAAALAAAALWEITQVEDLSPHSGFQTNKQTNLLKMCLDNEIIDFKQIYRVRSYWFKAHLSIGLLLKWSQCPEETFVFFS